MIKLVYLNLKIATEYNYPMVLLWCINPCGSTI